MNMLEKNINTLLTNHQPYQRISIGTPRAWVDFAEIFFRKTWPRSGEGITYSGLCAPNMHLIQKGFKSSVYRMKIEEQKRLLTMKRATRDQLRDREGGAWERAVAQQIGVVY